MIWAIILVPLALLAILAAMSGSQLQDIKQKFARMGTIAGRSKAEIIAVVGPPTSFSALAGGKTLLQWQHISQAGGYHIALQFDANDICEGITHEHAS